MLHNKIKPEDFGMICFLVLMENGNGVRSKAPDYIEEKTKLIKMGYEALGELDTNNQNKVKAWCEFWLGLKYYSLTSFIDEANTAVKVQYGRL